MDRVQDENVQLSPGGRAGGWAAAGSAPASGRSGPQPTDRNAAAVIKPLPHKHNRRHARTTPIPRVHAHTASVGAPLAVSSRYAPPIRPRRAAAHLRHREVRRGGQHAAHRRRAHRQRGVAATHHPPSRSVVASLNDHCGTGRPRPIAPRWGDGSGEGAAGGVVPPP